MGMMQDREDSFRELVGDETYAAYQRLRRNKRNFVRRRLVDAVVKSDSSLTSDEKESVRVQARQQWASSYPDRAEQLAAYAHQRDAAR